MPPIRPRVLVSNDDGINAPGLRALVAELIRADCYDVLVCAPSKEQSGKSHAITLHRYMSCYPVEIPGVLESFAVDGSPADAVMLALRSPVFKVGQVDLVVSGINRGDNCGLHIIYSGTVGAAREATCKGVPAIAFSLDNYTAKKEEDYKEASLLAVPLIKALLDKVAIGGEHQGQLQGCVLNVNFPAPATQMRGFYLSHQSYSYTAPDFREMSENPGPHLARIEENTPNTRLFRNYFGGSQEDVTEGGDWWCVKNGWVSVTPLGLYSDLPTRMVKERECSTATVATVVQLLESAASVAGVAVGGVSKL